MSLGNEDEGFQAKFFLVGNAIVRMPSHTLAHAVDGSHGPEYYQVISRESPSALSSPRGVGLSRWRRKLRVHFRGIGRNSHRVSKPVQKRHAVEAVPCECQA